MISGGGYCEFINNIKAAKRIVLDLNTDVEKFAGHDVQVLVSSSTNIKSIADASCDIAFASNFFEHLTKQDIIDTVKEICRILKEKGNFLVLQPNIRFCYKDYWNFFDHITPLDDKSLREVLETNGFNIVELKAKFLPYSTKSKLPKNIFLIKLYLKMAFLHHIFGKQAFLVAQKA